MNGRRIFACGAAVGAFVGVMVGMSMTPVVATVISALVGTVTTYCTALLGGGLKEAVTGSAAETRQQQKPIHAQIYLAGFCTLGLAGMLGGVFIRAHDLLSPTPLPAACDDKQDGDKKDKSGFDPRGSVLIAADLQTCDEAEGYLLANQWNELEALVARPNNPWEKWYAEHKGEPEAMRHAKLRSVITRSCKGS